MAQLGFLSYLLCRDRELNSRQLSCTHLRHLNSGHLADWAIAASLPMPATTQINFQMMSAGCRWCRQRHCWCSRRHCRCWSCRHSHRRRRRRRRCRLQKVINKMQKSLKLDFKKKEKIGNFRTKKNWNGRNCSKTLRNKNRFFAKDQLFATFENFNGCRLIRFSCSSQHLHP